MLELKKKTYLEYVDFHDGGGWGVGQKLILDDQGGVVVR